MDRERAIWVWIVLTGPVLAVVELLLLVGGSPLYSPVTLAVGLGVSSLFVYEPLGMLCAFVGLPLLFLGQLYLLVASPGAAAPVAAVVAGGWILVVGFMFSSVTDDPDADRDRTGPGRRKVRNLGTRASGSIRDLGTRTGGGDDDDTKIWRRN